MIPYFSPFFVEIPLWGTQKIVLHSFGLMAMCAFFLSIYVANSKASALKLNSDYMFELYLVMAAGIIVGGHLGYVFLYKPSELVSNPSILLDFNIGLSSFGGISTCLLLLYFYTRWRNIPISNYQTPIVYSFPIGWFVARLGCTLNHEHPGTETTFFLGRYCRPVEGSTWQWPSFLQTPNGDLRFAACLEEGSPVYSINSQIDLSSYSGVIGVHDMGFYEALYALVVSIVFYVFARNMVNKYFYLLFLAATYLPVRFFMDFFRPVIDNPRYWGLTPAQWFCVGGIMVLATFVVRNLLLSKSSRREPVCT